MDIAPVSKTQILITPDVPNALPAVADTATSFWGADGLSFKDILDTINPFQQLPGVSTIYRAVTGDSISTGSRLIGGGLLGGPVGFLMALVNEMFESATGKDVGGNIVAMIDGEDKQETEMVENTGAPSPTNRAAYAAYQTMQSIA